MAIAPGWYKAQGDPEGTHRYWDGSTWVGDPVRQGSVQPVADAGGFQVTAPRDNTFDPAYGAYQIVTSSKEDRKPSFEPAGPPPELTFLPGLKVLAVIVSGFKALGLVVFWLLVRWVADVGPRDDRQLRRFVDADAIDFLQDETGLIYTVFAILAVILVVQVVVAFAKVPLPLFILAAGLTVIDIGLTLMSVRWGTLLNMFLYGSMLVGQATIAFWSFTVYRNGNTARTSSPGS